MKYSYFSCFPETSETFTEEIPEVTTEPLTLEQAREMLNASIGSEEFLDDRYTGGNSSNLQMKLLINVQLNISSSLNRDTGVGKNVTNEDHIEAADTEGGGHQSQPMELLENAPHGNTSDNKTSASVVDPSINKPDAKEKTGLLSNTDSESRQDNQVELDINNTISQDSNSQITTSSPTAEYEVMSESRTDDLQDDSDPSHVDLPHNLGLVNLRVVPRDGNHDDMRTVIGDSTEGPEDHTETMTEGSEISDVPTDAQSKLSVYNLIKPRHALHGGVYYFASVCPAPKFHGCKLAANWLHCHGCI